MVEAKAISQPFTLKGGAEQDFWRADTQSAYIHVCKVWGSDSWCSNLGITSTENRCQSLRTFAERPPHTLDRCLWRRWEDQIDEIDDFVGKLNADLVSFTTNASNQIVRNAGEGNGLEAWRRLHSEYDPTSSMRRVAILEHVQNPPRCQRVEDLGLALEDSLKETSVRDVHGQERMALPLPGIRRQPCGGHVPVDAKEVGRDRHVHQ